MYLLELDRNLTCESKDEEDWITMSRDIIVMHVMFQQAILLLYCKCLNNWDIFFIILLGLCICEVNWQAAFEDAYILVDDDLKWVFGACNQLHVNVVSLPDRRYHIQVYQYTMKLTIETFYFCLSGF